MENKASLTFLQKKKVHLVPKNILDLKSSCFDAERLPDIDIKSYLTRIVKFVSCSKNCFLVAMIYLDRLIAKRDFVISMRNIHRLLITR